MVAIYFQYMLFLTCWMNRKMLHNDDDNDDDLNNNNNNNNNNLRPRLYTVLQKAEYLTEAV